jgi:hypothetical protein
MVGEVEEPGEEEGEPVGNRIEGVGVGEAQVKV